MKARDHFDATAIEPIVERVRKTRKEGTPEARGDFRKRTRKICDEIHDPFQGLYEGIAEPWTLGLVPFPGQRHIGGRLRTEADPQS